MKKNLPVQPVFYCCTVCGEKKNEKKFPLSWRKPDQINRVCIWCTLGSIGHDYKKIQGSLMAGGGSLCSLPWETWKPHPDFIKKQLRKGQEKYRDTHKDPVPVTKPYD
jgi:hypothetical protein